MKNSKKKKFFIGKIILLTFIITFWTWITYWIDSIWDYIKTQIATWSWSNSNTTTISRWAKTTYYINKDNNNNYLGDYLRWFYYDNIYWYFRLDWSSDLTESVHFENWPIVINYPWNSICNNWYKLWWKAYSKYVWFINFNFDASTFVYYCKDDNSLHWHTNSISLWRQSFEWIQFRTIKTNEIQKIEDNSTFKNNSNLIKDKDTYDTSNNNFDNNESIWWWDKFEIERTEIIEWRWKYNESIFWIIK